MLELEQGHGLDLADALAAALRHRGRPRIGPGELAVIRLLVREEEDRVDIIAQDLRLTPYFVQQIACAG